MSTETDEAREVVRYVPTAAGSLMEMPEEEFDRMKGIASALNQSGVFKDVKGAPVAFAKMVIGRELGLGVGQSMMGIHLVEGGVQMHYSTMLACVRAHGWKYRIPEQSAEKCVVEWIDPDGVVVGSTEFTMEDAERAEIIKRGSDGSITTPSGKSSNYAKYPKNMLLARCVSNGVKAYVPEALGGMPVYVTGELEAERSLDGLPGGSPSGAPSISLADVAEDVPEDLRDRFYAVHRDAGEVRPGMLSPAAAQMAVRDQDRRAVEAWLDREEEANARARKNAPEEPVDAEVVEPDEDADGSPDVEALRARLSSLLDQRTNVEENPGDQRETEAELARLDGEIDEVEGKLRAAGGSVPGQGAMDV